MQGNIPDKIINQKVDSRSDNRYIYSIIIRDMTKKQMVEQIQVAEAKAWKQFRVACKQLGGDDPITAKRRTVWIMLYDLREALGIEAMGVESLMKKDLLPA